MFGLGMQTGQVRDGVAGRTRRRRGDTARAMWAMAAETTASNLAVC